MPPRRTVLPTAIASLLLGSGAVLIAAAPVAAGAAEGIPAPVLYAPRDKMEMTDVASYFRWSPIKDCGEYEIDVARDSGFRDLYKAKRTKNVRYHEDCYFPKDLLPAGAYWWRVRAIVGGKEGPWSEAWSVRVSADHSIARDVVRAISPERPVFMMRNRAWDPRAVSPESLREILPKELGGIIIPDDIALWTGSPDAIERARKYDELGIDFVVWNNRARAPLALLEYLFQNFRHCIGTAEGEQFGGWHWERGPEGNFSEEDYLNRAWALCAKYGRIYFWAEAENGRYLWTSVGYEDRETFLRYRRNIVPMLKSTAAHAAPHSLGAVEGLMAAGYMENCGFWADEWIWPGAGFGKLGEMDAEQSRALRTQYGTKQCPWAFDIQMWLIGIAGGATAFHLESTHQWTKEAKAAENYRRFFLPFITAVVKRGLIPSRQALLESIKVAVDCNYEWAAHPGDIRELARQGLTNEGDPRLKFLTELYALKHTWYQEILPDNSRYGIICLLPPKARCLNPQTLIVPQEDLIPPGKAAEIFNRAYPQRFQGDAFMWECDGTVIVTNANENLNTPQKFSMPLARGPVQQLAGTIGVHQYLIGKIARDGGSFWFQTNCQYPERTLEVELACPAEPQVTVTPAAAKVAGKWDAARKCYAVTLSVKDGPAECEIRR